MNQREAKRRACGLAADAINALLDSGWPFEMVDSGRGSVAGVLLEDDDGQRNPDAERLENAIHDLIAELDRRADR